jgi:hypothetical protein
MTASADDDAPPKLAASPPPFPLWRRMAMTSTIASSTRIVNRSVYIGAGGGGGGAARAGGPRNVR